MKKNLDEIDKSNIELSKLILEHNQVSIDLYNSKNFLFSSLSDRE